MFHHRAQRQRGHEIQRRRRAAPRPPARAMNSGVWRGQGAGGHRHVTLGGQAASNGQHRDHQPVARDPHRDAQRGVVEGVVRRQATKGAAIVIAGRGERVQDFRESMRAGIANLSMPRPAARAGNGRTQQHHHAGNQQRERGHLHLIGFDLLAQVLGRAPDHEAGDEHRHDGEHQHAVEAAADAAEHDFTQLHQPHRHQATQRREGAMHRVHGTVGGRRRGRSPQRGVGDAEAHFLAFHVAAGLQLGCLLIHAQWVAATDCRTARPR